MEGRRIPGGVSREAETINHCHCHAEREHREEEEEEREIESDVKRKTSKVGRYRERKQLMTNRMKRGKPKRCLNGKG